MSYQLEVEEDINYFRYFQIIHMGNLTFQCSSCDKEQYGFVATTNIFSSIDDFKDFKVSKYFRILKKLRFLVF